jgi:hypothetical protein
VAFLTSRLPQSVDSIDAHRLLPSLGLDVDTIETQNVLVDDPVDAAISGAAEVFGSIGYLCQLRQGKGLRTGDQSGCSADCQSRAVGVSELRAWPSLVLQSHHRRIHDRSRSPRRRQLIPGSDGPDTHVHVGSDVPLQPNETVGRRGVGIWKRYAWRTCGGDHEHEDGGAHEHATGPGLCETRCASHVTQNVSFGWNAIVSGNQPRLSLQFNIENVSNNVYLLSKESTMVQGSTPIHVLFSGSLKIGF